MKRLASADDDVPSVAGQLGSDDAARGEPERKRVRFAVGSGDAAAGARVQATAAAAGSCDDSSQSDDPEAEFLRTRETAVQLARMKRRLRGTEFEEEVAERDPFAAKIDSVTGADDVLDELSDEVDEKDETDHDTKHWAEEEEYAHTVEPFNLRDERRDGYFDATGFYVARKFTQDEQHDIDTWLDHYDRETTAQQSSAMASARAAFDRQNHPTADDASGVSRSRGVIALCVQLVDSLLQHESPRDALRRIGKEKQKIAPRQPLLNRHNAQKQRRSQPAAALETTTRDPARSEMVQRLDDALNKITESCSELLMMGGSFVDIYDDTREVLQGRLHERLRDNAASRGLLLPDINWEYRVHSSSSSSNSITEVPVQGPFSTDHMLQWYTAGFFRPEQQCEIRRAAPKAADTAGVKTQTPITTAAGDDDDDEGDIFEEVSDAADDDVPFDQRGATPLPTSIPGPFVASSMCELFVDDALASDAVQLG